VVHGLGEGGLIHKFWDDIVLLDGEVECELVNHTPLDQPFPLDPFNNGNAPPIFVRSFHGFHRSDSTNFEDILRDNVPN
jgi:hypothetical protein